MPARSMRRPPGLRAGPLCLRHNFVTLFTDSASVFNPLFLLVFWGEKCCANYTQTLVFVRVDWNQRGTNRFFFGRDETSKWWLKRRGSRDLIGPDWLAPFLHLNIFKRTSDLKPD